jgi:hypothetical protein
MKIRKKVVLINPTNKLMPGIKAEYDLENVTFISCENAIISDVHQMAIIVHFIHDEPVMFSASKWQIEFK